VGSFSPPPPAPPSFSSFNGNRQLTFIHRNAFANLKNLIKLDLSSTSVSQLPTIGLHQLRMLMIRDNYALKQIPSIFVFPMLEEAQLTYSFHCCSFRYPKTHDPSAYDEHVRLQNEINAICFKRQQQQQQGVAANGGAASQDHFTTASSPAAPTTGKKLGRRSVERSGVPPLTGDPHANHELGAAGDLSTTPGSDFEGSFFDADRQQPAPTTSGGTDSKHLAAAGGAITVTVTTVRPQVALSPSVSLSMSTANRSQQQHQQHQHHDTSGSIKKQWLLQNIECGELVQKTAVFQNVICTPTPDAFNPCEDIMGYPVLRVAVWFVVACSVFGNMSVIVVLLGIFKRLSVPKFLQLNLAIGDLFMGVYLAMLATADITTMGKYFNYALDWQLGLGCQLAGASSLFASQLSIFTLIVITFERYYTITYSIDLNMRLKLGWAAKIMLIGWIYAFASAMLPIFANINSYSRTSICLPMRIIYNADRRFILVLLVVDSCAFLIIFICYLRMYLLIVRQKTQATLKERTVAMRMALLVLTDFACWAPIIFFSSTAVFGHPLISVTNSKILIVFFYPLNSMANPFLYVLSTRQYRRDLNYVISRWHHWRKNLFKSHDEKDYSFNNANPYGKYPTIPMNAHLNAVAAVTGVADHLHGYRIPIGPNQEGGGTGQRIELIKFGQLPADGLQTHQLGERACQLSRSGMRHGCQKRCNHVHHKHAHNHHRHQHHHHHHHHARRHANNDAGPNQAQEDCDKRQQRANGLKVDQQQPAGCALELSNGAGQQNDGARSAEAEYIIRHQLLQDKCHRSAHHTFTSRRTIAFRRTKPVAAAPPENGPPWGEHSGDTQPGSSGQQQQHTSADGQRLPDCNTAPGAADKGRPMSGLANNAAGQSAASTTKEALASDITEAALHRLAPGGEHQIGLADESCRRKEPKQRAAIILQHQEDSSVEAKEGTVTRAVAAGCCSQPLQKLCMCSQLECGQGKDDTDSRTRPANWTSRLNIRRDKHRGVRKLKSGSPSKSGQNTMTTDANTSSSTGPTRSLDREVEAIVENTTGTTTTTTTTTTTNTGSNVQSRQGQDGVTKEPAEATAEAAEHEQCCCRQHRHRHQHKKHHQHHHHKHPRHHHGRSHRCRSADDSGKECANKDCHSCSRPQKGSQARVSLERITEASNTDRLSSSKSHASRERHPSQVSPEDRAARQHHHHHRHHNQHQHRSCQHEKHGDGAKHVTHEGSSSQPVVGGNSVGPDQLELRDRARDASRDGHHHHHRHHRHHHHHHRSHHHHHRNNHHHHQRHHQHHHSGVSSGGIERKTATLSRTEEKTGNEAKCGQTAKETANDKTAEMERE
jgi:hypothetical protein